MGLTLVRDLGRNLSLTIREKLPRPRKSRNLYYDPQIWVTAENSRYVLSCAQDESDLLELFRFRHNVFFEEDKGVSLDFDKYDYKFDHLIIRSKKTGHIVGTYRVTTHENIDHTYTAEEFKLKKFASFPGRKMELGRAAIDARHRNGFVLDLLWKGLGAYAQKTEARYIFGCSSVMTTSEEIAVAVGRYFEKEGYTQGEFCVKPQRKYRPHSLSLKSSFDDEEYIKRKIPSLIYSYLKAGAVVSPMPAIDRAFGCSDFLTILDLHKLSEVHKKRYFTERRKGISCA